MSTITSNENTQTVVFEDDSFLIVHDERLEFIEQEDRLEVVEVALQGPPGPPGPQGESGNAAGSLVWPQTTPSASWVIPHNLGKYPAVFVQDSAGDDCDGDVNYDTLNQITITFSAAFSGNAYLN